MDCGKRRKVCSLSDEVHSLFEAMAEKEAADTILCLYDSNKCFANINVNALSTLRAASGRNLSVDDVKGRTNGDFLPDVLQVASMDENLDNVLRSGEPVEYLHPVSLMHYTFYSISCKFNSVCI